jgi:hypothetical protein
VWGRRVDGQVLNFYLAGINNQNFLMRDVETGSYWQQVSGEAIAGPLKGSRLTRVASDELSWRRFRAEAPDGTVLHGEAAREGTDDYAADWEAQIQGAPTVVDTTATPLPPRALIFGLEQNGATRAYTAARVREERVVHDELGGVAVLLWAPDAGSVRAFERRVAQGPSAMFTSAMFTMNGERLIDDVTGSSWDFTGCAVAGPALGQCLRRIDLLLDFWFDWYVYHPDSGVYGAPGA